jgi:hypothetical protein
VPEVVPPLVGGAVWLEQPSISGEDRMSAFDEYREELERAEQMYGMERGRLAVSLDRITNAMVLVGQHGVYCTSIRNAAVPAMDIQLIVMELASAKELLQSVMEEMRRQREAKLPGGNSSSKQA